MTLEQVAAICGVAGVLGGLFLWVVRMVVSDAIHKAINGFKTEIALLRQESAADKTKLDELYHYTHNSWHEQINTISQSQLEAFRAGQESRRKAD